jgi:predicted metal-binding membrane protein
VKELIGPPSGATAASLLAASAAAWVAVAAYEPPLEPAGFLFGWTLMMAAMMLPSIVPLAALYRGGHARLAAGYVAAWGATGLLAWAAMENDLSPTLPLVLAAAGVYELTPLKRACLRRCRNPAGFLMEHYRSGPFRLGIEHALWCIGCCVGLMAVLVLAASMSILWAAGIAGVILAQKALPLGEACARLTAVALLVSAAVAALS